MKKVISLFLSLAMLLSIVSVVDFSAYASVKKGKCGTNVTYSLDTLTDVLTISGTGDMKDYSGKNSPFYEDPFIESIIIENGVTSIGVYAFYGCTSLTNVTIGNNVTSIGSFAFEKCTSLTNVTIPNSVTSIGSEAFYNTAYYNDESNWNNGVLYISDCLIDTNDDFDSTTDYIIKDGTKIIANHVFSNYSKLKSIIIPDSVTTIGDYAFYECTNLTNATIGNGVTSIGERAFLYCTSLASVTIGNSVTSIGDYAFKNCTSLTSVSIPNSVTSIGDSAFDGCTSLTSVNYSGTKSQWKSIKGYRNVLKIIKCTDGIIGNGNTVTIDNLKYEIYNDTASLVGYTDSPENLVISKNISYEGYTLNVTSIGESAFKNCTSLTSITIPNSVTSICYSAFYGCTSLTSITIPDSVTSIGGSAFSGCTSLSSVTVPDSVTSIGDSAFYGCTSLTSVTVPDSVTSIGDSAFYGCTSLTNVTIPDSVTSIGSYAFEGCTSLTSVNYSGTKSQCKSIEGYYNISKIIKCTDGIVGNGNTVTIDNLKYKIYDDTASLVGYTDTPENLIIPESVLYEGYTVTVTGIGDEAFYNCTSLTSITIPDSVTIIGNNAFNGCRSLVSVTIPNSVKSIGSSAFNACSNLKSVNYNGTKAQWKSISGYDNVSQIIKCTDGIYANSNTIIIDSVKYRLNDDYTAEVISYSGTPENIAILESVAYEGFTFKVTSIGSSAFKDCTSLTYITIPSSITTIGYDAFNGCSKLKKIEVPDSVTYIGSDAFDGTAFYNTVKNWKDGVLYCGNHLISAKSDVTKITVKASTVSIAAGALDNCKSLEKINVLNPKCVINCTIPKTAVIGGAEGSTAEDFAQKNNMSIDYFEECTHSDKVQVVIAATCTEQGAVQSRCADCDKLISQTFTAPLGHTMVITTPAKAPTCTTSGNTQAGYCTVCGYNEVSTVIPATGHNFGNNSANCLVCGVANPNYVAPTQPTPSPTPSTTPTQPNQNDTNTSNDEDVTVISKPKSASIKKVKSAKKAILVTWKKVNGVNGYEIQVATDKKFKKNKKTVTIKKQKTTKTTVKKLKAKKKYYVRVRTYKIVNGKKVYSSWSKVKSVKTK